MSMKKRPSLNSGRPSPAAATPSPPIVIWSNSAYSLDDRSSAASNTFAPVPCNHASNQRWFPFNLGRVGEEELRLREELAREIEKELERELMEGILALVRRLSDLKARQIERCDHRPGGPFFQ